MVFPKKFPATSKTQFKKGYLPCNKGKSLLKASPTLDIDIKPFTRLSKDKTQIIVEKAENPSVRFLRPKEIERPEVEKCAESESNTRYEIFFTIIFSA